MTGNAASSVKQKVTTTLTKKISTKIFGDDKYYTMAAELRDAVSEITPTLKRSPPNSEKKPTPQPDMTEVPTTSQLQQMLDCFMEELHSFKRVYGMDLVVGEIRAATNDRDGAAANAKAIQRVLSEFQEDISNFGRQFFTSLEAQHPEWKKSLGVTCVHHKQTNQFAWVDKKSEAKYMEYMNKLSRAQSTSSTALQVREGKDGAMSRVSGNLQPVSASPEPATRAKPHTESQQPHFEYAKVVPDGPVNVPKKLPKVKKVRRIDTGSDGEVKSRIDTGSNGEVKSKTASRVEAIADITAQSKNAIDTDTRKGDSKERGTEKPSKRCVVM